jgi:hypothetical protein
VRFFGSVSSLVAVRGSRISGSRLRENLKAGVRERERKRKRAVREVERKAQRWQDPMGRHGCY